MTRARIAMRCAALLRGLAVLALVIVATVLLAGFGGGDHEPDVPTPQMNCAPKPVECQ